MEYFISILPSLIPILAGGVLFSAFILSSRMRLFSLISWFRIQSILLAAYVAFLGVTLGEATLYATAVLIILAKVIFVPMMLAYIAERPGVSQRLESYVRPAVSALLAGALIAAAFFAARVYTLPHADYTIIAASFSLVLIGFLLLITR